MKDLALDESYMRRWSRELGIEAEHACENGPPDSKKSGMDSEN